MSMSIKCPRCGSTAQTEFMWEETDKYADDFKREYECGCGCTFIVSFKAVKTEILCIDY